MIYDLYIFDTFLENNYDNKQKKTQIKKTVADTIDFVNMLKQ